jgi:elongation factor G
MKNGGPIGRYEVLGYTITLTDGRTHSVDSSADTFKLAAIQAIRELLRKVGTILLEPLMEVAVYIPHNYMGMVIGDLNSRGGLLGDTIQNQNTTIISATVPLRAMNGYIDFLRAVTSGTGSFTMEPKQDDTGSSVYAPVPQELIPMISKSREHIHYKS